MANFNNNKFMVRLIIIAIFIAFLGIISIWGIRVIYPYPYKDYIDKNAKLNNLPADLITAVIRVESKFRNEAVSGKGAKGLMQLMPDTASWINQQRKIESEEINLFDPKENISIGSWYLAYLIEAFDGNVYAALASYNGGKKNVETWLKNGIWDGSYSDIESIPYKETRKFVQRVIKDYKIYSKLY